MYVESHPHSLLFVYLIPSPFFFEQLGIDRCRTLRTTLISHHTKLFEQKSYMAEKNFATAAHGAEIAEVSYEAAHVASNASNLLLDREDLLWITGEAPQHVTVRLASGHPPLSFVGWHVWHDYRTNPKTVEIYSGVVQDCMTPVVACNALPGAGTQLWELSTPIPTAHSFVKFRITSTFGPGPTYMNSLALFATHPGAKFLSSQQGQARGATANDTSTSFRAGQHQSAVSSSLAPPPPQSTDMSSLLKELDEDIRALHPIKTISPSRTAMTYVPPPLVGSNQHVESIFGDESPPRRGVDGSGVVVAHQQQISADTTYRLNSLEQAVTSLARSLEHQREDIATIKSLLVQQHHRQQANSSSTPNNGSTNAQGQHRQASNSNNGSGSSSQVHVQFPEEALRAFVEDVLAPKLSKYAKRTEARTLQRMDEHIHSVLKEIANVVDERVKQHLHAIALDVEHPYHYHFLRTSSASTPHAIPASQKQGAAYGQSARR